MTTVDFNKYTDTVDVTNRFRAAFYNSGVLCNGKIFSLEAVPNGKEPMLLGDIIVNGDIDKSFFIEDEDAEKWKYMKGAKTIERTSKTGYSYTFPKVPLRSQTLSTVPVVRCSPVRAPRTAAPMRLPTLKQGSCVSCCRRSANA